MLVTVAEDGFHRPLFLTYLGEELRVDSIDQQWQSDAEPGKREPVTKLHYQLTLENGERMTVFKNMDQGGWYRLVGMG